MTDKSIYVKMLGKFTALFEEKTLKIDFSSSTKMMQLLALLLFHRDGIHRDKLLIDLYGNSALADSKNNLRVTVSRLRKVLGVSGLPDAGYITVKEGVYRFGGNLEIQCDVNEFYDIARQAKKTENADERYRLSEKACSIYAGEFLPGLSSEEWVMTEQIRLKNVYLECLEQLCYELRQRREYERLLEVTSAAAKLYPYDELQTLQIDALMAMSRYDEAMGVYDKTVSMYFDDLGLPPSDNMLQRLRAMSDIIHNDINTVDDIMAGLSEKEKNQGAYYCSFPSFIDNFRMLQRLSERDGRSCYLVICTMVGKNGKPIEDRKRLYMIGNELKSALEKSLRRGDTYTKYSASQFLLLLAGLKKEDASIVTGRIDRNVSHENVKKTEIKYKVLPLVGLSMDNDTGWQL